MSSFKERLIGAAKLNVKVYEEVESDKDAMRQAVGVVLFSSIAAGIGNLGTVGSPGIFSGTFSAMIGWFMWSYLVFLIGTKLLPERQTKADYGEVLRTIGFSSAPGIIRIAGIISVLRNAVFFVASLWMIVAMVVAVRQALDYKSTGRAVAVCVLARITQIIVFALFVAILFGSSKAL